MSAVTPAAAVLLSGGPASPDVLLVRRAAHLRFFGGFWAFPGGKVEPGDADVPLAGGGFPGDVRRVTAVRELFEETGVLLARRSDGSSPAGPELAAWRREVLDDGLPFAGLLLRECLAVHAADLCQVGALTTPAFTTIRFDTTFYVAHKPPGQAAEVWPGELDDAHWSSADAMLGCWERGECLVSPPTVTLLAGVRCRPVDEAPARLAGLCAALAAGALHPIHFAPQVQLIPLRTAALPPSEYTNAFLVGHDPAYLLDPGPDDPAEQCRLFDLLDGRLRDGLKLRAVVLTHQHRDHVGAATACADRYGVPVWAHPATAEKLAGRVVISRYVNDGDRLDLGTRPDGRGSWHLEAVHTPGHADGHLAFWEPAYRLLLVADMVSPLTSIILAPPEGDLVTYLASLRRLQGYDARLLLPAHGSATAQPAKLLGEALAHRAKREKLVLAALSATPQAVEALTPELYKGTPAAVLPLAEKQLLAHLLKLQREGRAELVAGGWRLAGP